MPTLEWIGKDKVVNHHQEVPYRVLERQYSYNEAGQQWQRKHTYLLYRFSFEDDMEHLLVEIAPHFHLSESCARAIEALLDSLWMKLP